MAECSYCGCDVPDFNDYCGACDYMIISKIECIFCGKKYAICAIDNSTKRTSEKCEKSPHGKHEFRQV